LQSDIEQILALVATGKLDPMEAFDQIKKPYDDLGFAKVDSNRASRTGYPEAIYCPGKTPEQVALVAKSLVESGQTVIATKATKIDFDAVSRVLPQASYNEIGQLVVVDGITNDRSDSQVVIITGGSSDIPIAEEAAATVEAYGINVIRLWDVGVAGINRLLVNRHVIDQGDVAITVAGMEGALPSVVAGLVNKPVIAVPTSVGYGASLQGVAAMLTMINSCAPGISVVNIDNGFGAGYQAALICQNASNTK